MWSVYIVDFWLKMKKMHLRRNPKNDAHSNPGQMKAFVQGPLPASNERRLFLEDGTPSDYLGSSVLKPVQKLSSEICFQQKWYF